MLACRDYEAMEVALANHAAYLPEDVQFFILQNCRGGYDADRTLAVARRYEQLYPRTISVIEDIPAGAPYHAIARLLASPRFANIDLICKVDDDAFPIAAGWLDALLACWADANAADSSRPLAYVTPLINNNTWGFRQVLDLMGLHETYIRKIAREHRVGSGHHDAPLRILPHCEIYTGTNGTVWGYPYIARWLHEQTTLQPDRYIAATRGLTAVEVPSHERYSIGCILFRKELWAWIDDGGLDDEHMLHQYCRRTNGRIICARSVPFVHFAYFAQREENRDIVEAARKLYEPRLKHPFPIAMRANRQLEIEARLRWMEGQGQGSAPPLPTATSVDWIYQSPAGHLSPEQFGIRAAKGVFRAILFKLRLTRRAP